MSMHDVKQASCTFIYFMHFLKTNYHLVLVVEFMFKTYSCLSKKLHISLWIACIVV